jgi:hypothetical protein
VEETREAGEMVNAEIVAQLEAERLRGMPRWQPRTAWDEELRRRAKADTQAVYKRLTTAPTDDAEVSR